MDLVTFFTYYGKTAFIPLKYVYPECNILIDEHPQMFPLACFERNGCPANRGCAATITHRVHYLIDKVMPKGVELIIAYYKYRDKPESVRGCEFWTSMDQNPRILTFNRTGFKKILKDIQDPTKGQTFQWRPTLEYSLLTGDNKNIIPISNLIR